MLSSPRCISFEFQHFIVLYVYRIISLTWFDVFYTTIIYLQPCVLHADYILPIPPDMVLSRLFWTRILFNRYTRVYPGACKVWSTKGSATYFPYIRCNREKPRKIEIWLGEYVLNVPGTRVFVIRNCSDTLGALFFLGHCFTQSSQAFKLITTNDR